VKLTVALELAPGQSDGATAGEGGSSSSENSAGTLPEEPLVREIVTNAVTNENGESLVSSPSRKAIRQKILSAIQKQTDVKVEAVLFPDLTVQ
jgi:flagellar FliL protein